MPSSLCCLALVLHFIPTPAAPSTVYMPIIKYKNTTIAVWNNHPIQDKHAIDFNLAILILLLALFSTHPDTVVNDSVISMPDESWLNYRR